MVSKYDFFNKGSGRGRSITDKYFDGKDVWIIVKETEEITLKVRKSKDHSSFFNLTPTVFVFYCLHLSSLFFIIIVTNELKHNPKPMQELLGHWRRRSGVLKLRQ